MGHELHRQGTAQGVHQGLQARHDELAAKDAYARLGLAPGAADDDVKKAFRVMTKEIHPARYARHDKATSDLATEVFLLVKQAHDELLDPRKRAVWDKRVGACEEKTAPVLPNGAAARPQARTTAPPAVRPQARTTAPPAVRPQARTTAPPTVRPQARTTAPPTVRPQARTTAPPTVRPQARTTAPPTVRPQARTTVAPRPGSRGSTPRSTATTIPPGLYSGLSRDQIQQSLEQAKTRPARFESATTLLYQKRFKDAQAAFDELCTEDPQSKKFRMHRHWAAGMQKKQDGDIEGAVRELERAAALDPKHAELQTELASLPRTTKQDGEAPGLLSKLFGR